MFHMTLPAKDKDSMRLSMQKTKTYLYSKFRYDSACSSSQFTCGNGLCVEASMVCDGTCHCSPDCEDENGNGETDCRCKYKS